MYSISPSISFPCMKCMARYQGILAERDGIIQLTSIVKKVKLVTIKRLSVLNFSFYQLSLHEMHGKISRNTSWKGWYNTIDLHREKVKLVTIKRLSVLNFSFYQLSLHEIHGKISRITSWKGWYNTVHLHRENVKLVTIKRSSVQRFSFYQLSLHEMHGRFKEY